MSSDLDILHEFDTYYTEAYYAWDPFYPEAERDLRFYLGDQWDEKEKRQLFQEGRNSFVFNRVRPVINFLTGYQRQHRNTSVFVPFEDSDQKTADQYTQCMSHVMNNADGYRWISDCFSGALKTGWNLLSIWVDYRDDPVNGDIRMGREPYNGFICDPYFTQLDWSDCSYILKRKYLGVDHVASLLPGQEKEVWALHQMGWERDDKFSWLPYQRQPNGQDLMAYNEFYMHKWKNVDVIVDNETGNFREWPGDKESLNFFLSKFPQMEIIKKPKKYIEKHIIVNDHVLRSEMNPYDLDEYPFVPMIAIFESESDQWGLKIQSLIRTMKDPQRESNRRRSQMIDLLDSQINSGWIAKEKSVINPRSLFQSSQGKVIWKREDAPPDALEKIPPAQIPPSMFQLQELFDKDVKDVVGVNDATFGEINNANESGVMQLLRQGAAIANQQELMDNLRYAQQYVTRKCLKLIQNWTPGKVERLLNEPPTEDFYKNDLGKYDIQIQEGLLTTTQKQQYFRQLVDLQQLGAPVTGEMLAKAAPIQGKSEYNEEIAALEKQQAKQAQEEKDLQERILLAQEEMSKAKSISDIALSKERFTRAVANMGLEDERASAAVENRADAVLKRAKAAKELESMDDGRMIALLDMFVKMEELNRVKEERLKSDDVQISAAATEATQPERTSAAPVTQVPGQQ